MPSEAGLNFDAGLDDVVFDSQGSSLLGGFYRGGGSGPRPTVILLQGVPGVEKNLDISYRLRDEGWNCLYFHYRGCWDSEGKYSFGGALDDVAAATDWVLAQASVDPQRLVIIGNSFGGYLALLAS
ncbi:MAG: alpha/beta hydrolase family protein [Anaerolineales bacterium]